jgi:pentatricopeptide repeat protein
MARCNVNPADLNQRFSLPLLFAMINSFGVQQGVMVTSALGEPFSRWFTSMIHKDSVPHETGTRPTYPDSASSRPVPSLVVDRQVSRLVDEHAQVRGSITPVVAFERFRASATRGLAPASDVFARLIGALGRLGEIEKVMELYTAAQAVLNCVNDRHRSGGWFQVEDSMVIAFAHARDLESANAHRQRIIGSGGQPSADAYAALILCIKDTTDDASAAMELFEESQRLQVRPNTFLYNNIISKLARARKADHALELFRRMKEAGLRPTAITYGALIGACARVGDAASAEVLFAEMTAQPNFRPRIPPYNTMMQLYVSTKPDRDRAFYYFNAMLDAGIQPSEHTYKLLLDFYGNMEPIDLKSVEEVFLRLQSDPQVQINGTHWAALITAHGCSAKDLNKALEIFESIPSHPSSSRANPALPDALVYEGLMSVLVTLQRADLLPVYLDKMVAANVRPTAYVYNLLIKGYATMDIELARRTFEELQDPPVGVAAPNNHAGSPTAGVSPEVAVYREPSTWEAMVRAELGYGDRERALSLVERMQSRNFPEAVVNRVRGIFLDEAPLEPSTMGHSTVPTGYLLDNSSITSSPSLHEAAS